MTTLSLSLSAVERIVAVHTAAADRDRDRTSPVLNGVCIKAGKPVGTDGAPCMAIVATDGKILVEETWTLDAGQFGIAPKEFPTDEERSEEAIISAKSIDLLASWTKQIRKSLGKRPEATLTMLIENKQVTIGLVNSAIGDILLACVDGRFPNYEKALDSQSLSSNGPARIGFDCEYMARLAKLWGRKGMAGPAVVCEFGRGIVIRPLPGPPVGCQRQRALVMPISLPT